MDYRDAILSGISNASEVYSQCSAQEDRTSFNILSAVSHYDIPIMFRPLQNLLGATIDLGDDYRGILVTSKRDLCTQRFTIAHELGHCVMQHDTYLDHEIADSGRFQGPGLPLEEIAANTFASELLANREIIIPIAAKRNWNSESFLDPLHVYQLSLRLGLSYQATCWGLGAQEIITKSQAAQLSRIQPRDIKINNSRRCPHRRFPSKHMDYQSE